MRKIMGWLCGVMLALAMGQEPAQASGTLNDALGDLAKDVKEYLDTTGKLKVSVGQFPGRGEFARSSSAGPLFQTALEQHLKARGVDVVSKKADYELSGEYTEMEDTVTARQFVQIKLELRDKQGNSRLFEGITKVDGKQMATKYYVKQEADVAKILGPTVYLPPGGSDKQRNDVYKKEIDNPRPVIKGTKVFAGENAPFAVEILTARGPGPHKLADYNLRQPLARDGLAFVPIPREEVYAVRVINNAPFDVAVDLRIDGLSMFHASEVRSKKTGLPSYRYIIMSKQSHYDVRGWFINLKDTDEFLVTEYAKSEAGKIGHSSNVGTITATFHAAWDRDPKKGSRPADEPRNPSEYSQSADATARGDRITTDYTVGDYQIGVFRGAVSIRYAK